MFHIIGNLYAINVHVCKYNLIGTWSFIERLSMDALKWKNEMSKTDYMAIKMISCIPFHRNTWPCPFLEQNWPRGDCSCLICQITVIFTVKPALFMWFLCCLETLWTLDPILLLLDSVAITNFGTFQIPTFSTPLYTLTSSTPFLFSIEKLEASG